MRGASLRLLPHGAGEEEVQTHTTFVAEVDLPRGCCERGTLRRLPLGVGEQEAQTQI